MTTEYKLNPLWQTSFDYFTAGPDGAFTESVTPAKVYQIREVRLHCSSPFISNEAFIIRVSSVNGSAYNHKFMSQNMNGITDLNWFPDKDTLLMSGDQLVLTLSMGSGLNNIGVIIFGWSILGC